MGTLDDLVAKDAAYRAEVAACSHDFTGRSLYGEGPVCTRCAVLEVVWMRSEVARLRTLLARARAALDEIFDGPPEVWADWYARNKDVYEREEHHGA